MRDALAEIGRDLVERIGDETVESDFVSGTMQPACSMGSLAAEDTDLTTMFPLGAGVAIISTADDIHAGGVDFSCPVPNVKESTFIAQQMLEVPALATQLAAQYDIPEGSYGIVTGVQGSQVHVRFHMDAAWAAFNIDPLLIHRVPWCAEAELWMRLVDGSYAWRSLLGGSRWADFLPIGCTVQLQIPDDEIAHGSYGTVVAHEAQDYVRVHFKVCRAAWSFRPSVLARVGGDDV